MNLHNRHIIRHKINDIRIHIKDILKNVNLSALFTSETLKTDNLNTVSALAQRLTCRQRVIKMNIKLN